MNSPGASHLPALFWVAFATMLTAPFGAKAERRMKVETLHKLFALMLIVLATKLLLKVLGQE